MHKGINTTMDEGQTMVAHALRGEGFDASEDGTGGGTPIVPVAIQERAISENADAGPDGKGWRDDGTAYTLEARQVPQAVAYEGKQWAVRRLTPTECERLQGFPDNYTRVPGASSTWRDVDECEDVEVLEALGLNLRKKGNGWQVQDPDGPRYKALGNSMAVNVMRWIGRRIEMVEKEAGDQ
jgi:DNA (cytosine-5)-methyltransferase 1